MPIAADTPDDDDDDDNDGDMQGLLLAVLAVAAWPLTTGWGNVPGGSHVRALNETNFQETMEENCCVLVFFHAEWCQYCGPIKPVFAEVTAALQSDHCIVAASVDCTDDPDLAIRCNIHVLPSMLFFCNGKRRNTVQYRGNWSAEDMRLFAVETSAAAHKPKKVRKTGGVAGKKYRGQGQKQKILKFIKKK
ncbi:protein disulfide-isomerase-like, partial [Myzus persicae]|uniref:protein disulfide-isomerase-like n=1 Tax=Myzus persicae TaxID=13164 RepID=UPI000B93540C